MNCMTNIGDTGCKLLSFNSLISSNGSICQVNAQWWSCYYTQDYLSLVKTWSWGMLCLLHLLNWQSRAMCLCGLDQVLTSQGEPWSTPPMFFFSPKAAVFPRAPLTTPDRTLPPNLQCCWFSLQHSCLNIWTPRISKQLLSYPSRQLILWQPELIQLL